MLDLDAFGSMLRAARERRRLRPIDLALAMNWSGTAPVYRYERGGPAAPRPDPDTVNLFAQVLDLDDADRITLLGFAGHVPDTTPLTPADITRMLDFARPELAVVPHPAALFDQRWQVLALNPAYRRLFGLPPTTAERWRRQGVTLLDLVWDPSLLCLAATVPGREPVMADDPAGAAEVQMRRFQLAQRLRRHEAWYRAYPTCRAHLPGFVACWSRIEAELAIPSPEMNVDLVAQREAAVLRLNGETLLRFEASHREVHGASGTVGLLVMVPLDRATEAALDRLAADAPDALAPG